MMSAGIWISGWARPFSSLPISADGTGGTPATGKLKAAASRLYSQLDGVAWYVDTQGDLRMDGYHHDGHNYYLYRKYRQGVSEEAKESFKEKILDHTLTKRDIERVTERLGDDIAKVYGFSLPSPAKEYRKRRNAR